MAKTEVKDESGTLAKAAQVVKESVIQPVGKALGLIPSEPKPPTKSERKASRKVAAAARRESTK
jgi:hypothetical protein